MASGQTQYYGLSQWEAADKVERVDFNSDNAKIDGALHQLAQCNCRMYFMSYTGTGAGSRGSRFSICGKAAVPQGCPRPSGRATPFPGPVLLTAIPYLEMSWGKIIRS